MKYLKITGLFTAAMLLLLLAACGGNNKKNDDNPPPPAVSITITPTLNMLVDESKTLTVTPQNTDFTVSVNPTSGSGCEKSDNTVVCEPTLAGTYTVTVTATADTTKKATAQVNVFEEELEIDENAGEITEITSEHGDIRIPISFTAASDWTASMGDVGVANVVTVLATEDCDVEPKSGPAGYNTVNVTCAPNATNVDRVENLVVSSGGVDLSFPITQKPTPQGVTFTPGVFTTIQGTNLLTGINDSAQMVGNQSAFQSGKGYLHNADGTSVEIAHPITSEYPTVNNYVSKINNSGQAAGAYGFVWMEDGMMMSTFQGFVYDNGAFHDFEDFPAEWNIAIGDFGINDSGHVVGSYIDTDSGKRSCFLKTGDVYTTIDYPGAAATYCTGINNNGLIVGYFTDTAGKMSGFLYDESKSGNEFAAISHPAATETGWVGTIVWGINDSGMMAGYYMTDDGIFFGFLHDGDDFVQTIAHPGTSSSTMVFDINNNGQIVGSFMDGDNQYGFLLEQSN